MENVQKIDHFREGIEGAITNIYNLSTTYVYVIKLLAAKMISRQKSSIFIDVDCRQPV